MMMRDMNRRQIPGICGSHEEQIILMEKSYFQKIKLKLFHSRWCGSWCGSLKKNCIHFAIWWKSKRSINTIYIGHDNILFAIWWVLDAKNVAIYQTEALPLELMWVFKEKLICGKMSQIIFSNWTLVVHGWWGEITKSEKEVLRMKQKEWVHFHLMMSI